MKKIISILITVSFLVTGQIGACPVYAASFADGDFRLPAPGLMIHLSPEFNPPILKGIKVHPDNPFRFDFILDQGDVYQNSNVITSEASRLIKYFLASLTIPEQDLWVNLSPYEKDRIVPQGFGQTEMGRDLLAEDYMLKQITASLIYPEDAVGKKFWKRIYQEAAKKFGTTNIPVNTFNKVWIVPDKAVVYENAKSGTAYVIESKLKVMLEQDYLSLRKHTAVHNDMASVGANIVREIVIPELTKEVNEDKNFSQLRQVYNSLILAAWYKKKIKDSILSQIYEDKRKIAGVGYKNSPTLDIEAIYQRYLQAFKKGVYNYIKEEQDPMTQQMIPRKYFSGGTTFSNAAMASALSFTTKDTAVLSQVEADHAEVVEVNLGEAAEKKAPPVDFAMSQTKLRRLPMDDDEIKTYFMAFRGYETVPGHELYIPVHHFYKQENGLERWDNLGISQVLALLGKEFVPASHNRREYIRDIEGATPLVDARVVYANMQTRFQFTWKPGKRNEWAEKQEQALQINSNVPPEVATKISFIKGVTVKQGKNIFEINVNQEKNIEIKQFVFNGNENELVASDHGIRKFSFGNDYRISYKQEPRFSFNISQKEDGEYFLTFKDVRAYGDGSILTWTSLEAKPHFIYKGEYQMSGQTNGYKKKNLELVNPSNGTMALISGFDDLPEGAAIEAAKSIDTHLLSWDFNSKTVTKSQIEKPAAIDKSRFSAVFGRVSSLLFFQADPNGHAILKDLIEQGYFEEVSSAEVRLKKIEGRPVSRPPEIAGRNFDHIWSILEQPSLIKLPKLLDPNDKDSVWESSSTSNLVRLKRRMVIVPDDFPEIPKNNEFWAILHEAQSRLDWKDVMEKLIQNGWAKYIDPSTDPMTTPSEIYLTADLLTEKEKMEEKLGKDFSRIYPILQQSHGIKSNREFRQFMELHSLSIEKDLDQYPSMEITLVAVWQDPRGHGWLAGVNTGNNRLNLKKRSGEIILLSGGSFGKKRKGERPDVRKHIVSGVIIEPGDTVFVTSGIGPLGKDFVFEGDSLRAMTRQLIDIPNQHGKKGFSSVVALRVYPGKDANDVNNAMAVQVIKSKRSENIQAGNKKYGGIDLTPANMHLQTNNAGSEIRFHIDPAMLKQLQNAPGFVPVIINVHPLKSLPEFLGLSQESAEKPTL